MTIHQATYRLLTIALVSAVLLADPTSAQNINDDAGTSGFSFLKINISARAVGMGGAFTGLADDISSLYYNPAGIAGLDTRQMILGYHNYFFDIQSGFAGITGRLSETETYGVHLSSLFYGNFIETNELGQQTGEFGGSDLVLAFTVASSRSRYISFGLTGKFIYEKIQKFSATGVAVDIGAKYLSDRKRLSAGIMIQNLGIQLSSLGEEKDKLPLTIRAGLALRPKNVPILLATDLIMPMDNDLVIAIGGEYFELKPMYARIGWNSFGSNFRVADSEDNWAGLSFGVGFDFSKYQVSYSYSPGAELGESHRVTLVGSL